MSVECCVGFFAPQGVRRIWIEYLSCIFTSLFSVEMMVTDGGGCDDDILKDCGGCDDDIDRSWWLL